MTGKVTCQARRRQEVTKVRETFAASERRVCRTIEQHRRRKY
jgi:hypothetical protein